MEVGLGLGSNQGDRAANLSAARQRIQAIPGVTLVAQSHLYETEPVGVKPEYRHLKFINAVLVLSSDLPIHDLQQALMAIETEGGRARTADKFAPRPLDIDLLFAGTLVMETPGLKLPHPQCFKRRFVLEPLAEVLPDLVLPGTGVTVKHLLKQYAGSEQVLMLPDAW